MAKAKRAETDRQENEPAGSADLKVRPQGSESGDGAKSSVRAGTLFRGRGAAAPSAEGGEDGDQPATPVRKVALPGNDPVEGRYPYATHGPAPADEKQERRELDAMAGRSGERQVSAGFLLGVALIAVTLLGAIWVGRLGRRVRTLERQVAAMSEPEAEDNSATETAQLLP